MSSANRSDSPAAAAPSPDARPRTASGHWSDTDATDAVARPTSDPASGPAAASAPVPSVNGPSGRAPPSSKHASNASAEPAGSNDSH